MRLANASIPFDITTLPGLYAYYDCNNLSSLWQDSARTTPVTTVGDPVGAIDDLSGNGHHQLQATSGNRGVLTLVGTSYGITFDGSNTRYAESSTTTLALPVYLGICAQKLADSNLGVISFGNNSTNHASLGSMGTLTNGGARTILRNTAHGQLLANSANGAWIIGATKVIDGLSITGTTDNEVSTLVTAANAWAGDTIATSKVHFDSLSAGNATANMIMFRAFVATSDPSTSRAGARSWLGIGGGI